MSEGYKRSKCCTKAQKFKQQNVSVLFHIKCKCCQIGFYEKLSLIIFFELDPFFSSSICVSVCLQATKCWHILDELALILWYNMHFYIVCALSGWGKGSHVRITVYSM